MGQILKTLIFDSAENSINDITASILDCIKESSVESGTCVIQSLETTAGLMIVDADYHTQRDICNELFNLAPSRYLFTSTVNTPANVSGNVKSALIGTNLSLIIENGSLLLGDKQRVVFAEFNGPRKSKVAVKIVAA